MRQPYPGWIRLVVPGWACYKCSAARSTMRWRAAGLRDGTEDDARGLKQCAEHAGTPARGWPIQLLAIIWSTVAFAAGSRAECSILDDDR